MYYRGGSVMTEIEIREIREAIDAADNALLHLIIF